MVCSRTYISNSGGGMGGFWAFGSILKLEIDTQTFINLKNTLFTDISTHGLDDAVGEQENASWEGRTGSMGAVEELRRWL